MTDGHTADDDTTPVAAMCQLCGQLGRRVADALNDRPAPLPTEEQVVEWLNAHRWGQYELLANGKWAWPTRLVLTAVDALSRAATREADSDG